MHGHLQQQVLAGRHKWRRPVLRRRWTTIHTFLLLHFKQSGHAKYGYEAFRLLAKINVTVTPKESFEMTWKCVCSTCNGSGHNIPLDLEMERMNWAFKDDLKPSTCISLRRVSAILQMLPVLSIPYLADLTSPLR